MSTSRYQRQIVLSEIGTEGQDRLARARVLVVGSGGLGAPVLLYLAAAGVGQKAAGGCLRCMDDDQVDLSNLQRQILFSEHDIGQPKVAAAARRIQALNSDIAIEPLAERLTVDNVLSVCRDIDIIVDGSDNFATKYLLNDVAVKLGKPVVYGSILGFEGQATVFWPAAPTQNPAHTTPCYRCLYPAPPQTYVPNCAEFGTLGGIAGLIGSVQAIEVCKLALGLAHCQNHGLEILLGKLWWLDAGSMETRVLTVARKPDCPLCSLPADQISIAPAVTSNVCGAPSLSTTTLTLEDLAERQNGQRSFGLLDVRQPGEWAQGHLPGAQLIPLSDLLNNPDHLTALRGFPEVLVYCQMGMRSRTAVSYLREQGINALNLKVDWAQVP